MKKKMTLQEMIDERHQITETLTKAMGDGTDMSMAKYAKLNDRYHWLNNKITKKEKK